MCIFVGTSMGCGVERRGGSECVVMYDSVGEVQIVVDVYQRVVRSRGGEIPMDSNNFVLVRGYKISVYCGSCHRGSASLGLRPRGRYKQEATQSQQEKGQPCNVLSGRQEATQSQQEKTAFSVPPLRPLFRLCVRER